MSRIIFWWLVLCPMVMTAQNCSQRYVEDIFEVEVIQEPAIYATVDALSGPYLIEAFTYTQNLSFDFYQPLGDDLTERPLVIMAFGGAFLVGDKRQAELVDYCRALAAKGYCVASIDYRIGFNFLSTNSAIRAVYRGAQDFNAAVRYFRANATTYGIDPDYVFGGGASAGAISAINAAYLDESERGTSADFDATYNFPDLGCLDCSGNAHTNDSKPNAVVNLWGAIRDVLWIDAGDAPIISFHGTADETVNINTASPFNYPIFPALSGSNLIHARTDALGITNELNVFQGGGHELWNDTADALTIQEGSANFLAQLMPAVYVGDGCNNQNPMASLSVRACLSGAFDAASGLMRDDLRSLNLLPTLDPYLNNTTLNTNLLTTTGNDAIVDWVLVEVRDVNNPSIILEEKACLLQRDGDVVDAQNANTELSLNSPNDTYYIAIRHRNHLGAMTANVVDFTSGGTPLADFKSFQTPLWGTSPVLQSNGINQLWAGDADENNQVIFQGASNDVNSIFFDVLGNPNNANSNINYILTTYSAKDVNLDGQVIYQGASNDPNTIFFTNLTHPSNVGNISNIVIDEQLP